MHKKIRCCSAGLRMRMACGVDNVRGTGHGSCCACDSVGSSSASRISAQLHTGAWQQAGDTQCERCCVQRMQRCTAHGAPVHVGVLVARAEPTIKLMMTKVSAAAVHRGRPALLPAIVSHAQRFTQAIVLTGWNSSRWGRWEKKWALSAQAPTRSHQNGTNLQRLISVRAP